MKLAVLIASQPIRMALELTCEKVSGASIVAMAEEAEAVICEDSRSALAYLKQGKVVAQFVLNTDQAATGLLEAYPDQFKVFTVISRDSIPDVEIMWLWLAMQADLLQSSGGS